MDEILITLVEMRDGALCTSVYRYEFETGPTGQRARDYVEDIVADMETVAVDGGQLKHGVPITR